MAKKLNPPSYLSAKAKKFFRDTVSEYELEPHHVQILVNACTCLDRIDEARQDIKKYGRLIPTKDSMKPNPAISIELQNKKLFSAHCRELRLDHEEEPELTGPGGGTRKPRMKEGR